MSDAASPFRGESAVKLALKAREARQQTRALLAADPIAVIGMGCRVPGGASPEAFWRVLYDGVDCVRDIPEDRWDAAAWHDPDLAAAGKSITRQGGFMDQIDRFDAAYFDILPREAEQMDPQQRLLLEVAFEALDDAGLPQPALAGSRTGVYIASYHNDYAKLVYADLKALDPRSLTGTLHSVLANRVSYLLDLRGPSLSVDTACSSSLVAIHLACQSLRLGECDMALAGGVSVIITPDLMVSMSKVGFMAPDGRCKTFDASADGFGRGEGCGVLVLKRLADAIADEDRILSVIRGSAVNQDGRSTLLAAPNGPAQEALIREALAGARVEPARIGFVEAHGTGTALGDPIEVEAIAATIGRPSPGAGECLLGSAKANLGHLEAAAGVVGTIKAIQALRHEAIPGQIHYAKPNPHMSLAGTRLAVPQALTPWPRTAEPRCAAVSSFGVGGTNAHVIFEEAPKLPVPAPAEEGAWHLLPLSAKSEPALRALMESWLGFLDTTAASLTDLCHTASVRRTHYPVRTSVAARSVAELRSRLSAQLAALPPPASTTVRQSVEAPRIAFVFSGQGTQWHGMARELLDAEPVFRETLEECDALLKPLSGWSILERLALPEDAAALDDTGIAQSLLFAIQVALVELLKSWGVTPEAVIGHSIGEIAALHTAGVIDRAEAIRIVWHRGRVMQPAKGQGRMASVALSEAEARALASRHDGLDIGAVNAPRNAVLSGTPDALSAALARLAEDGVSHRELSVAYAFHGRQMEGLKGDFLAALGAVRWRRPDLAFYSTVTGDRADDLAFDARYLARNIRQEVRFAGAVAAAAKDGIDVFLEIGPHPALGVAIQECMAEADTGAAVLATLRRGRSDREMMLACAGGLYAAGCALDWGLVQPAEGSVTSLPAYAWQKRRYWLRQAAPATVVPASAAETGGHPLLGRKIAAPGVEATIFEGGSGPARYWLDDHRIFGRLLVPGAAVMEAMLAAAGEVLGGRPQLTDFAMHRPLILPETGEARWLVVAKPEPDGRLALEWFTNPADDGAQQSVASATAGPAAAGTAPAVTVPDATAADASEVFAHFADLGVDFGPGFRCLEELRIGEGCAQARIVPPEPLEQASAAHGLHPVLLDAAIQLCSLAAGRGADGALPQAVFLPLGLDQLDIYPGRSGRLTGRARLWPGARDSALSADAVIETEAGEPVAVLRGMRLARTDGASLAALAGPGATDETIYERVWQRIPAPPAEGSAAGTWLLFCAADDAGAAVARVIKAGGGRTIIVRRGEAFDHAPDGSFRLDPADAGQYRRLLLESVPAGGALRGVVHAWALDTAPGGSADAAALAGADERSVGSVLHLVRALAEAELAAPLTLVTRGAQLATGTESAGTLRPRAAGLAGLATVIALEHPELKIRVLDLDPDGDEAGLTAELVGSGEPYVALRRGARFAPRLARKRAPEAARQTNRPLRVTLPRPGTFEGLALEPLGPSLPLKPDEVRVRVLAAGLNFRDVLTALGMYPGEAPPLGVECAGVVTEIGAAVSAMQIGDRVFGYAPGSFGGEVVAPAAFLARIPDAMKAEVAAGQPVAYLTALYGLFRLAKLRPGERVLIHSAAGGVGLAAVQLARRAGAEVLATAGSEAKREMLRGLGIAQVMDSRSLAFEAEVMAATGGRGVDVVLNALAGDFIPAGIRCLAPGGRFLELGKRGVWSSADVAALRPDVGYHLYDLGADAEADHALLGPLFDELTGAFADGSLRPLPVTVFPLAGVAQAMRYMAQAKHIGKVVLRVAPDAARAAGAWAVSDAGTYLVTGGLGALGLQTAEWLVRSGARHLVLTGRSAPGEAAQAKLRALEATGAVVKVVEADAADRDRMADLLASIDAGGHPLRGVIHAAGVLNDAPLLRQRWPEAAPVLRGKAHGAWVLHELTLDRPLDFFVLYSAAGLLLGAAGQGLYPAANAELDALALYRRRLGLPALSIAWGLWRGAGMASAHGGDVWSARGLMPIEPAAGFAALEHLLADGAAYGAVIPIDWERFLSRLPAGMDRAFFAALAPAERKPATTAPSARAGLLDGLRARPLAQRRQQLLAHLSESAILALGLEPGTAIDPKAPLKNVGLDSLMAVELRNVLVRSAGQSLPATLLFDYPTLEALAGYLMTRWGLDGAAKPAETVKVEPKAAVPEAAGLGAIEDMSDAEAEALLLKELALGESE